MIGVMNEPTESSQRWTQLGVLAVAMVLAMSTWFSASAVSGQLVIEWGLSTGQASWLTISVQIGFVVGAVVSATFNLADLIAPRRLLLFGTAGAAAANIALLAADGAATAIPIRFMTGAFLALVYPPALKAMSTWFRVGRGLALGVMVAALTVGSALPHLVNGLGGADWRVVIGVTSLLTLLGGMIAEFAGRDGPYPFPSAAFEPRQIAAALRNREVRLSSLGYLGHMWELYAMWAWFAAFFADTLLEKGRNDSATTVSLVTFVVIAVGAIGCVGAGLLADRFGRARIAGGAMVISGACAFAIGPIRSGPLIVTVLVAVIWGITVVADSAQFSTVVTEVADQAYVGTAVTLQLASGFVLSVATIWLVPEVERLVGWDWAFMVLVPGPVLGVWAMARLQSVERR
jgi:MFS family permease